MSEGIVGCVITFVDNIVKDETVHHFVFDKDYLEFALIQDEEGLCVIAKRKTNAPNRKPLLIN